MQYPTECCCEVVFSVGLQCHIKFEIFGMLLYVAWKTGSMENSSKRTGSLRVMQRTLIVIVQIAVITSNELFNTRLSGRDGSYSQMAIDVSMAAIFVIWVITSTSARLTT